MKYNNDPSPHSCKFLKSVFPTLYFVVVLLTLSLCRFPQPVAFLLLLLANFVCKSFLRLGKFLVGGELIEPNGLVAIPRQPPASS